MPKQPKLSSEELEALAEMIAVRLAARPRAGHEEPPTFIAMRDLHRFYPVLSRQGWKRVPKQLLHRVIRNRRGITTRAAVEAFLAGEIDRPVRRGRPRNIDRRPSNHDDTSSSTASEREAL